MFTVRRIARIIGTWLKVRDGTRRLNCNSGLVMNLPSAHAAQTDARKVRGVNSMTFRVHIDYPVPFDHQFATLRAVDW